MTICDECPPARAASACAALADYEVDVLLDRVHLLRDHAPGTPAGGTPWLMRGSSRVSWSALGGMPTEISVSALGDPEVNSHFCDAPADVPAGGDPIVVVARHEPEVVAAARGWASDGALTLDEVVGDLDLERQLLRAATRAIAGRA